MNFASPYIELPKKLTVSQNLDVYARLYGVKNIGQRIEEMAEDLNLSKTLSKEGKYEELIPQLKALITGEEDVIANLANVSAGLKEAFGFLWVGFYLVKNNELVLDGKLNIKIKNSDAIFQFLLTPKKYRTNLKKIDLDFVYNFDQNILNLNNIRIDKHQRKNIDKILNNLIFKGNKLQNKVYLKSKFNKALKAYAG